MKPLNMTVFFSACESVFITKSSAKEPKSRHVPKPNVLPRLGHFFNGDWIEKRHAGAKLLSNDLNGVLGFGFTECHELLSAGVLVRQEALGECTILNLREDRLHSLAAFIVDDARAAYVV